MSTALADIGWYERAFSMNSWSCTAIEPVEVGAGEVSRKVIVVVPAPPIPS
jgi:hypothetical protein